MPKNTESLALPPDAVVGGHSMEFWTAQWWTTLLQSPAGDNLRTTGSEDLGPVTLLGGDEGAGGNVTRHFQVEAGDKLLVPVLNLFDVEGADIPFSPTDPAAQAGLRDAVLDAWSAHIDLKHTSLKVDGQSVEDLGDYFHRTGVFSMGTVKGGSLIESLGVKEGGLLDGTEAAGIMVMLRPLPEGRHTIVFRGAVDAYTVDATPFGLGELSFDAFDFKVVDHIIVA